MVNEGFAFDNFSISQDFSGGAVLEHFTNSAQEESKSADDIVDDLAFENPGAVIDIQYHMDYPGIDSMYLNYPFSSTRFYHMEVPSVPFAILNGREESEFRFDFSGPAEQPNEDILEQASLEESPFLMELKVDWTDMSLEATATITCDTQSYNSNVDLYMVVMETSVTAYTGLNQDTEFRNVVLDMLPTPAGKLLGNEWVKGDVVTKTFSWDYPAYVEDMEDLAVVAFVADRDNKGIILKAAASYMTPQVGAEKNQESSRESGCVSQPCFTYGLCESGRSGLHGGEYNGHGSLGKKGNGI